MKFAEFLRERKALLPGELRVVRGVLWENIRNLTSPITYYHALGSTLKFISAAYLFNQVVRGEPSSGDFALSTVLWGFGDTLQDRGHQNRQWKYYKRAERLVRDRRERRIVSDYELEERLREAYIEKDEKR